MDHLSTILKNTISLYLAKLISIALTILLTIFLARYLGDFLYGRYSYASSIVAISSIFLDLGYDTLLIREVSREKSKISEYFNNIISFRIILSICIFLLISVILNIYNFNNDLKTIIYLFLVYYIIVALTNTYKVTFRSFEKMEYEALVTIFSNLIKTSLSIAALYLGYGLYEIALIFLFSSIMGFLFSLYLSENKFVKIRPILQFGFFKKSIKIALPLGLTSVFQIIYVKIDTLMLAFFNGETVVGWYNSAYNLILGFTPIPHLFMHALLPIMSQYHVSSKDKSNKFYRKSLKYLFYIGLPLSIGLFLLSDKIILTFYGNEYFNSILPFKILSFDILLKFLYFCLWFIFISSNEQNRVVIISASSAVLNILLNLILIPMYSLNGAAAATVITETFLLFFFLYYSKKVKIKKLIDVNFIKPVISIIPMSLIVYYSNDFNMIIQIFLGIISYFSVLFLIKGFNQEDIRLIKKLLKITKD